MGDEDAEEDEAIGTTKDVFEDLFSHQLLLDLSGRISEVKLLISGRPPVDWWPDGSEGEKGGGGGGAAAAGAVLDAARGGAPGGGRPQPRPTLPVALSSFDEHHLSESMSPDKQQQQPPKPPQQQPQQQPQQLPPIHTQSVKAPAAPTTPPAGPHPDLVTLEEEVPLIAISFQGASVTTVISGDGFKADMAMRRLVVDDLLVSSKVGRRVHMARSCVIEEEEEEGAEGKGAEASKPPEEPKAGGRIGGAVAAVAAAVASAVERSRSGTPAPDKEDPAAAPEPPLTPKGSGPSPTQPDPPGGGGGGGADDSGDEFFDAEDAESPSSSRRTSVSGSTPRHAPALGSRDGGGGGAGAGGPMDGGDASLDASDPSFLSIAGSSLFDPQQRPAPPPPPRLTPTAAAAAAACRDGAGTELVRLSFARNNETSSKYQGLDVELSLKLASLVFYCNRPTVSSLMVCGGDFAAIGDLLSDEVGEKDAAEGADGAAAEGEEEGAQPKKGARRLADSPSLEGDSVTDLQLVKGGGETRTLFKITLQVGGWRGV